MQIKTFSYFYQLIFILLIKSLIIFGIILYVGLGLGPDEAQYWTWSKDLDFGYYSKPPGIAWQIALGTKIFGNTELGVRAVSVVLSCLLSLSLYYLALACHLTKRTAYYAALIFAFCPIGIFGAIFAITDAGMLLCWTCAALIMTQALNKNTLPHPLLLGLCILLGALFKWSIYFFWIYTFIFYCSFFFTKKGFKNFFISFVFSLCGLIPSIWWNWHHGWATFRHVESTLHGGHGAHAGNFFEFIGAQVLLFSPIFFVLLIFSFKRCLKLFDKLSLSLIFCLFCSLLTLLFFPLVALFQKLQGNWIVFAYPTGIILLSWYCCEIDQKKVKWLNIGMIFNLVVLFLVFLWPSRPIYYKKIPFKHNLGWIQLNEALQNAGYDAKQNYLLSDKYQTSSILSFYGPEQKRAYFLNLQANRKNQFSYWPQFQQKEQGKTGYFVWIENAPHIEKKWEQVREDYLEKLAEYFEEVQSSDLIPLIKENEHVVKAALFFKCNCCKSKEAPQASKY